MTDVELAILITWERERPNTIHAGPFQCLLLPILEELQHLRAVAAPKPFMRDYITDPAPEDNDDDKAVGVPGSAWK